MAAKENCVDVVVKLLEHGADVNAKDKVRKLFLRLSVCLAYLHPSVSPCPSLPVLSLCDFDT